MLPTLVSIIAETSGNRGVHPLLYQLQGQRKQHKTVLPLLNQFQRQRKHAQKGREARAAVGGKTKV